MRSGSTPPDLGDDLATSAWWCRARRPSSGTRPPPTPAAPSPTRVRLARSVCEGTASTTMSAPSAASAGSVVAADGARQAQLGQVVAVDPGVDLGDHLVAATPHRDGRAGIREHRGERRAPAAGAVDRCARHEASSRGRGLPMVVTPWARGSNRTTRGLLAAQHLELGGDRRHDPGGGLVQHLRGELAAVQVVEGHGSARRAPSSSCAAAGAAAWSRGRAPRGPPRWPPG